MSKAALPEMGATIFYGPKFRGRRGGVGDVRRDTISVRTPASERDKQHFGHAPTVAKETDRNWRPTLVKF